MNIPFPLLIFFPALALGLLNWLYWRSKGHTSITGLILGTGAFYTLIYQLAKMFR